MSYLPPPMKIAEDERESVTVLTSFIVSAAVGHGLRSASRESDRFAASGAHVYILKYVDRVRDIAYILVSVKNVENQDLWTTDLDEYAVKLCDIDILTVAIKHRQRDAVMALQFIDITEAIRFAEQVNLILLQFAAEEHGVPLAVLMNFLDHGAEIDPVTGTIIGIEQLFESYAVGVGAAGTMEASTEGAGANSTQ